MPTALALLIGGAGVLLVWSAIVNVSPVDELRAALGGGPAPTRRPSGVTVPRTPGPVGGGASGGGGAGGGGGGGGSW